MKETLTILFRRKWYAAGFFAFLVGVPVLLSYVLPPKYEAKATLLLTSGREKKPFVPTEKDSRTPFMQVSMEDVGSEVEILLSHPVLAPVVDKAHLDQECHPDRSQTKKYVACTLIKSLKSFLVWTGLKANVPPREDAIERLHDQVDVEFLKRTNIIEVTWRGDSPEQARDVVNALVDAYVDHHIKVHGNAYALEAIEQQVKDGGDTLITAEEKIRAFSARHSISNMDKQHAELLDRLSEADSKVNLLDGLGRNQMPTAQLGNIAGDPAFLELSNRLTDAELRRIDLSFKFNADSRQAVAVNQEIDQLKKLIKERLEGNLERWKGLADSYRRELSNLDQQKVEFDRLQRDIDDLGERDRLNREKLHEIMVSKELDLAEVGSVKVVQYAELSSSPAFPRRLLILVVSLFLGAVGAPTFAFTVDRLSGKVTSVAEIESLTRLPVLASVPEYGGADGMAREALVARMRKDLIPVEKALGLDQGEGRRVVLVTSPSAGAGSGLVAAGLARAAAELGAGPTLLLQVHHEGDGSGPEPEGIDLESALQAIGAVPNGSRRGPFSHFDSVAVDLGPGGREGAETDARSLIQAAKNRYARVVLDIPSRDGDLLYTKFVPHANDVLIVAAAGSTGRHPLARMVDVITRHGGTIAGCVLNRRRDAIPRFLYKRLFW